MNPNEPHRPFMRRERATALEDSLHGIAQELQNLVYAIEDEELGNPLVLRLRDAIEAHANALSALAHCTGLSWRVEK